MEQSFKTLLGEKGISLSPHQHKQFDTYCQFLIEWNEKMNLTAITDKQDVYLKHFYDSLTLRFVENFSEPLTLCDVGAGAGFPSLPVKICFPHVQVTIVDSLKKRIHFLEHLTSALGLEDVSIHHDRAEMFGRKKAHRESFDIVTARAVAKLSVLSEYCLPLVKTGGAFLAMKGAAARKELKESERALNLLGGEIGDVESLILPGEQSQRYVIRVKKIKKTPKAYPRKPGTPGKNPL
jgi:16S rRNA (guanine527-N7)-methyltransferase